MKTDQDVLAVSQTLGVEIRTLYQYSNRQNKHYSRLTIRKENGKERVFHVPCRTLKFIQRRILEKYLYTLPVSEFATAYILGKKLKDNAAPHMGKAKILKLDISGFFDAIDYEMVYAAMRNLGMSVAATALLANICIQNGVLPQGAPTSPCLANLVMRYFDEKVGAWCRERAITYTRYCDDMTFSGDFDAASVTGFVRHMLRKQGFELNERKTKCVSSSQRQNVTGIVVNEKLQVSAEIRRKLRQEVYYCRKYGVSDCVRRIGTTLSEQEYLDSLRGRISFALQVNPADEKMWELFLQINAIAREHNIMVFEEIEEKARTSDTLDELFDLWKLAHKAEGKAYTETTTPARGKHPAIEQTSFVRDGYVSGNPEDYANAGRKVLFILKEANILAYRGESIPEERDQLPFYRDYLADGKSNRAKQQEKMARMAYYLQHPELDEEQRRLPTLKNCQLALKQSAFMNLNKRGGDNHAKVVSAYSQKYAAFIERQIDLLAPDVIVVIGRTAYPMREGSIHVWHTAYRMPRIKRNPNPCYCDGIDGNVDLYMRRFFEVCGGIGK